MSNLIETHEIESESVSGLLDRIGDYLKEISQYNDAKSLYIQALKIRRNVFGRTHLQIATSYSKLGFLRYLERNFSRAEKFYQKALSIRQEVPNPDPLDIASNLKNLADLYKLYTKSSRHIEAESLYKQALEIRIDLLGDSHPEVAEIKNSLGHLYRLEGLKFKEAQESS